MRVAIRRNCLSYGGQLYTVGQAVDIPDDALARRLAENSGGDFVLSGSKQDEANAATPGKSAAEKPKEEPAPETAGDSAMGDSGTLPPPDLSAAVQRGKKK